MRRGTVVLALLGWAAATGVPLHASAFVRTVIPGYDTCLFWEPRVLAWSPGSPLGGPQAPEEESAALRRSFAVWEEVACSDLTFVEGAPAPRSVGFTDGGTNQNLVIFRDLRCRDFVAAGDPCHQDDSCENQYDCWNEDDRLIGVTITTYSQCSGRIVDADVVLNAAAFAFTTADGPVCADPAQQGCVATDVENTLVHEIGHVVGLDHTLVAGATMVASAGPGETEKRSLEPDDLEGLCSIYPAGAATSICAPARPLADCGEDPAAFDDGTTPEGCCSAGGPGSTALFFLAALGWALARVARRGAG